MQVIPLCNLLPVFIIVTLQPHMKNIMQQIFSLVLNLEAPPILFININDGPQVKARSPTSAGPVEKKNYSRNKKAVLEVVRKIIRGRKNMRRQFIPRKACGMKEEGNLITLSSRVSNRELETLYL